MGGLIDAVRGALIGAPHKKVSRVKTPVGTVARDQLSIMQQRGWVTTGNVHRGPFATPRGTYEGRIEKAGDRLRVSIKNPPMDEIAKHPKRGCFHGGERGWWNINLHTEPVDGDVNSVITYIERLLVESFKLAPIEEDTDDGE